MESSTPKRREKSSSPSSWWKIASRIKSSTNSSKLKSGEGSVTLTGVVKTKEEGDTSYPVPSSSKSLDIKTSNRSQTYQSRIRSFNNKTTESSSDTKSPILLSPTDSKLKETTSVKSKVFDKL